MRVELHLPHRFISPIGAFQVCSQGSLISGSFWEVVSFVSFFFFKLLKIIILKKKGKRKKSCHKRTALPVVLSAPLPNPLCAGWGWCRLVPAILSQHPAPSGVTAGTFRGLPITLQPWRRLRGQRGSQNREVREDAGSQQVTSLLGLFQGCPVRVPDFLLTCPDDLFSSVIFILCPFLHSPPPVCGLGGCKAFLLRVRAAETSAKRWDQL